MSCEGDVVDCGQDLVRMDKHNKSLHFKVTTVFTIGHTCNIIRIRVSCEGDIVKGGQDLVRMDKQNKSLHF